MFLWFLFTTPTKEVPLQQRNTYPLEMVFRSKDSVLACGRVRFFYFYFFLNGRHYPKRGDPFVDLDSTFVFAPCLFLFLFLFLCFVSLSLFSHSHVQFAATFPPFEGWQVTFR